MRGAEVQPVQLAGHLAQSLALRAPGGNEIQYVLRRLLSGTGSIGERLERSGRAGIAELLASGLGLSERSLRAGAAAMNSRRSSNGNGARVMGITRRQLILRVLASISTVVSLQTAANGDQGKPGAVTVPFEWQVPQNQVTIVRNSFGHYRGHESMRGGGRTIPLIVVFVGATLLVQLAKAVLSFQRQLTYGGVVIDARV